MSELMMENTGGIAVSGLCLATLPVCAKVVALGAGVAATGYLASKMLGHNKQDVQKVFLGSYMTSESDASEPIKLEAEAQAVQGSPDPEDNQCSDDMIEIVAGLLGTKYMFELKDMSFSDDRIIEELRKTEDKVLEDLNCTNNKKTALSEFIKNMERYTKTNYEEMASEGEIEGLANTFKAR